MRQILIVRHAIAEDLESATERGVNDEHRALTDKGRRKFIAGAQGLRRVYPQLDQLLTSPLLRAWQTAEILADSYGHGDILKQDMLAPGGSPEQWQELLNGFQDNTRLAIIGHEPDLSQWIGWALTSRPRSLSEVRKGSATCIEFDQLVRPGAGKLLWSLTPGQLRALAL